MKAWILGQEGSNQPWKYVLGYGRGNSEFQVSGQLALRRSQLLFGFGCEGCKFLGVTEKEGTLKGKGNVTARAVEEANAEFVFQCIDLKA